MARPKVQEQQRAHLAAAARRAIVTHGLAHVRIRDVAEAAGMSPGTVTYYYRQLDELFQQIYEDAVDRFHRQRAQAMQRQADPAGKLLAAIDAGLPEGQDDELCCLLYEFSPQARRRPGEAALRRGLFDQQAQLYADLLAAGADQGAFALALPAAEAARNLVALEDAYAYHIIAGTSVTRGQARDYLVGYASYATGTDLKRRTPSPRRADEIAGCVADHG
ncbi:TetR/AcrR family transcriptional regulator [Micromonospora halotolerans]|uniref:TetR/AcrR family transcriptional regulator n=1 Tax=Micromonospora halotolerans TaxID=709879 RepID=A0ABY9ZXL7_9ACTN|nr:TetR/AcrR family transcriptional regulator [Micromonospora halotolerans]WNM39315.1 TetR/AcrR family transcriptional regulator [Micromonospora halotolerans]